MVDHLPTVDHAETAGGSVVDNQTVKQAKADQTATTPATVDLSGNAQTETVLKEADAVPGRVEVREVDLETCLRCSVKPATIHSLC